MKLFSGRTAGLLALLLVIAVFGIWRFPAGVDENTGVTAESETHDESIQSWREARDARLKKPDGWLSLVGLEWLKEGESSIGSAADNDIRLSGGPSYWGKIRLQGDQVSFQNLDPENVLVNGEPLLQADMVVDTAGEPTVISSGTLRLHVILRGSYGLRIKDSQARALQNFKGVDNYPIDETWRIRGLFKPAPEGETIEIANVLGQILDEPVYGTIEFDRDGKTYSLLALGSKESKNLWFIFADRTTGHGTYGAGRYLYSDGMPDGDRLTVDFNKAYNPPCAFNEFSTCPLPPQRNRLDLLVEAGEKNFHPDYH